MKEHKHTNALIHETSPYLLQHAHNPVNWMPWGADALEKAVLEDKPLLVSIGYSACHWCHVMEHESFEDSTVAALMNENFVCIKVDREERPDVDQLYMSAVQLMTQRGGWPLNAIALPDGRPFWGGTYFPKENWKSILQKVADVYKNDRKSVEDYADQLANGIQKSALVHEEGKGDELPDGFLAEGVEAWKKRLDYEYGGNLGAPKFMIPSNLQFLYEYASQADDTKVEAYVENTLEKIALGGIYDQIGGGFARYSTDKIWKVPHFEKMLYDNAQLISLYSQAYRKNKNPLYRSVVYQTIQFLERELLSEYGMFYSALDADSEGEEGKFYVWKKDELQTVLKDDFKLFSTVFNINELGFWEHGNYILHRTKTNEVIASEQKLSIKELEDKILSWETTLLNVRSKRIRPGLDDKSLTSWNAMMGEALIEAYLTFKEDRFLQLGLKTAFALEKFQMNDSGKLFHSFKNGDSKIDGFLEDYAFVTSFYIRLFEATSNDKWVELARKVNAAAMKNFSDEKQLFFWFTCHSSSLPVSRQKEINDNVIPASNSVMANNLFKLGHLSGNQDFIARSEKMVQFALSNFHSYPSGYSNWARLALYQKSYFEIAIVGDQAHEKILKMHEYYIPNAIFCGANEPKDMFLTNGRFQVGKTLIYVCRDNTCQLPTEDCDSAFSMIK